MSENNTQSGIQLISTGSKIIGPAKFKVMLVASSTQSQLMITTDESSITLIANADEAKSLPETITVSAESEARVILSGKDAVALAFHEEE